MVSYLEVNKMLFFLNIYTKLHGAEIMPLQKSFQNLIYSQTTLCRQWNVTYLSLKISAISGQIFQKDMHSSALPEDAVILY